MTTQEMVDELRMSLGNRTDITDERYVQWLNWAQLDICWFHAKRAVPLRRFPELEGVLIHTVEPISFTLDSFQDYSITPISALQLDPLVGQVVKVQDQYNVILSVDDADGTLYLLDKTDIDSNESMDAQLYQQIFSLEELQANTVLIDNAEIMNNGKMLTKYDWREVNSEITTDPGMPTRFARRDDAIYLDRPIKERTTFRFYTYNRPANLSVSALDESPTLSVEWHEAIVQGAVYRGHESLLEPDRASQAYQTYVSTVNSKLDVYFAEDQNTQRAVKLRISK